MDLKTEMRIAKSDANNNFLHKDVCNLIDNMGRICLAKLIRSLQSRCCYYISTII